ncbi:MAG: efflux RND transporter periplasmic adaptor subunit [Gemmatimonadaceae bacterium]
MMSILKIALIGLPLIAAACGTPAEGAATPAEAVTPVRLADVVAAGGGAPITATGTLGAKDEVALSFKIGGIISQVLVDDGASVRRGQVLAVLDQREIDAMVAKATAGAEKSQRDAARAERLFKDSVVTLAQLQDAQTGRLTAEADLRAARVNHEFATIVAPNNGVVLSRVGNPGQLVTAGTSVIQFASKARGSVLRAGLPDREAVSVRRGAPALVIFDALPGRSFKGRVSQIGAAADARTGTFTVEVQLEGVAGLPSGLVGRLTIDGDAEGGRRGREGTNGMAAIPAEALVEGDGDQGVVYTVNASTKRARRVKVALVGLSGDKVLVRGLDGVSHVVTAGATWLVDSAKVEIKP